MQKLIDKINDEIESCKYRMQELDEEVRLIISNYRNRQDLMDLSNREREKSKLREKIQIYQKVLTFADSAAKQKETQ